MKLAWIVPGFSSDERDWCIPALLDLARVLAARHELHIFALHYPYRRDQYSVFGAQVHSIGGANRRGWRLPAWWSAALRAVTREHRRSPFEALHAFWLYEPGVIATWLKQPLGVRTVVSLAGGELIDLPAIGYGYAGRRWLRRTMRWSLRGADVVTAGSTALLERAKRIAGAGVEHFTFAPLGVDLGLFSPLTVRHAGAFPATIVNVGSLQPVKGQADLIRAFRFVADRQPQARLSIAGDGPLRSELEALAAELKLSDRVSFLGDVRREQLPDVYRRATLFVQTSLHEAQGMAVLEAAACGLVIVGTPVGALADLAPEAAVTAPATDPIRLAQTLLSVLDDPGRLRALAESARQRVADVYGLEVTAGRFEALYAGGNPAEHTVRSR